MRMDEALREGVIALAHRAAARILAVYDSAAFEDEAAIRQKDDRSPLTAADLASHRCIVDGLAQLTPGLPVLSEESAAIEIAARRGWRRFWCWCRSGFPSWCGRRPGSSCCSGRGR